MEISATEKDGIWIAVMDGKLDTANSAGAEERLMDLLGAGASRLVLDLGQVDYIASSGLRSLLKLAQRMKQEEGLLHLCSLNDMVSEVFQISGFDRILTVYDTEEQAVAALQSAASDTRIREPEPKLAT
jgi:anti-anti-sigma factor